MSTGDGQTPDEWDALLDDDFVRSGPVELSAEQRAERAARIRREHERVSGWRSTCTSTTAPTSQPRSKPQRARGPWITAGVLILVALAWIFRADLQPPAQQTPSAAAETSPTSSPTPQITSDAVPLGTPPPVPAGKVGDFRFLATQPDSDAPVTFDPCRPVRYVVRVAGQPTHGNGLLRAGLAEVSRATGLRFEDGGETTEDPSDDRDVIQRGRYGPGWSPVLIAWSDEDESPDLAGNIAGSAGPMNISDPAAEWRRSVSGQVLLDGPQIAGIMHRPHGRAAAQAVIMHELGHLVGLDHVADRRQIMFSQTNTQTTWGTGDLAGLNALGRGTCFVANGL